MARICFEGLPGKIGRCVITPPLPRPPQPRHHDTEEPGLYSEILVDVSILDAVHQATKGVSDKGTRDALGKGIESALAAVRKRAGKEVASITLED
jgi:hypothetical protein